MKETTDFESLCRLAENYGLAFTLTRHSPREWELNVWRELDAKGTRAHIFTGYGDGVSLIESFLRYDPPTDLAAIFGKSGFHECLIPPAQLLGDMQDAIAIAAVYARAREPVRPPSRRERLRRLVREASWRLRHASRAIRGIACEE